jgi:hypothetical protein
MKPSHLVGFFIAACITAAALANAANQPKPPPDSRLAPYLALQD